MDLGYCHPYEVYGKAYCFTAEGRKKARDAGWADAQRERGKLPHSTFFFLLQEKNVWGRASITRG